MKFLLSLLLCLGVVVIADAQNFNEGSAHPQSASFVDPPLLGFEPMVQTSTGVASYLERRASAPRCTVRGRMYFDTTLGKGRVCTVVGNPGTYEDMGGGGGAVTNSAGANIITKSDGANLVASPLIASDANTVEQRNGANAQTFHVYNTYTDAANNESLRFLWSADTMYLRTEKAGTGQPRNLAIGGRGLEFHTGDTYVLRWQITNTGEFLAVTDNTYDIGAPGATRPRTGYFGTSVIAPTIDVASTVVNGAVLSIVGLNASNNNEYLNFDGYDLSNNRQNYAAIRVNNRVRTAGLQDGDMVFHQRVAGVDTEVMKLLNGSLVVNASVLSPIFEVSSGETMEAYGGAANSILFKAGGSDAFIISAGEKILGPWGAQILKAQTAGGGNSNRAGGSLSIQPGESTGSGTASSLRLYAGTTGSSGTSENANALVMEITNAGMLFPTDNTYDIGALGANRPRTGYFGTSIFAPLGRFTPAGLTQSTLRVNDSDGSARVQIGVFGGAITYAGLWFGDIVPSDTNYAFIGNGVSETVFNVPSETGSIRFRSNQQVIADILKLTGIANQVNGLNITGALAGSSPSIATVGSDANISLSLVPKGTGGVVFPSGAAATPSLLIGGSDVNIAAGIWQRAADRLNIAFNGTNQIEFGDSGGTTGYINLASNGVFYWSSGAVGTTGGDIGFARNAAGVLEVNNGFVGGFGRLLAARVVTAKTTDYTVTNAEKSTFFTNTGATAAVVFTLATPVVGMPFEFYRDANHAVTVDVGPGITIRVGASATTDGGNVTLDAVGSKLRITAISTTQWVGELTGTATFN